MATKEIQETIQTISHKSSNNEQTTNCATTDSAADAIVHLPDGRTKEVKAGTYTFKND